MATGKCGSHADSRGLRHLKTVKPKLQAEADNVLSIQLNTSQEKAQCEGGRAARQTPRLDCTWMGIEVEAPLESNLVYCATVDVPGVYRRCRTILGNIKSTLPIFHWVRAVREELA